MITFKQNEIDELKMICREMGHDLTDAEAERVSSRIIQYLTNCSASEIIDEAKSFLDTDSPDEYRTGGQV